MIENQSENIDNKENDDSNLDNAPEDSSLPKIQQPKMMNYLLKKKKK